MARSKFALSCQLKSKVPAILQVLTLALVASAAVFPQQPQKLTVTASIWEYKSLCGFQDPERTPFRFGVSGNISTTVTGCMDIEKEHGNATAIRLLVKNTGAADEEFQIGSLKDVILRLPDGKTLRPIAIRWPWSNPLGGPLLFQFYTQLTGNWSIHVPAGAEINLVFLFEQASKGSSVQIGSMAPAAIR